MRVVVGILGVGPDVVLNERREGGLPKVPVAIDPRIDQKIQVVGVSASLVQTGPCRGDREMQGAVPAPPTPRCVSRSMTVPIAIHQILVHGQQNYADLRPDARAIGATVSPGRICPAGSSSTRATVWVVDAVFRNDPR